jgi:hypothetical protein
MLLGERLAWHGRLAGTREADRERRQPPVKSERLGRLAHRLRLGRGRIGGRVERVALNAHHGLGRLVVRLKVGVAHRPRPGRLVGRVIDEPRRIFAEHDVGVDERAAAETAAHHGLDAAERPDVEHPVPARRWRPQVGGHPARAARERAGRVAPAAFEHEHGPSRLCQPAGRRRRAEARADHHHVEVLFHETPLPSGCPQPRCPEPCCPGPCRPEQGHGQVRRMPHRPRG